MSSESEEIIKERLTPIDPVRIDKSRETISSMVGLSPDCIVVLAGGVIANPDGSGRSPYYNEGDNHNLITGAWYRVLATAITARIFPNSRIETNSIATTGTLHPVNVMQEELVGLGVNPNRIIKEDGSKSTFGNMIELIKLMGKNEDWKNIIIITNEYHTLRTQEILVLVQESDKYLLPGEKDEFFEKGLERLRGDARIKIVACEEIIGAYDPGFKEDFQRLKQTPEYIVTSKQSVRFCS